MNSDSHLCIGCGVCAAVCPRHSIEMVFGADGCYSAAKPPCDHESTCGLCDRVCPFVASAEEKTRIADELFAERAAEYDPVCGHYGSASVGYLNEPEQRLASASGGLGTWFLRQLMISGLVDDVVCVTRNDASGQAPRSTTKRLFHYSVISDADELRRAAKSAYYPVHPGDALRQVIESKRKYAVVGLPCVCSALRLAQAHRPQAFSGLVAVVGLVCGHGVSSFFAEYASALAGAPPDAVEEVIFRVKDERSPASDFGTEIKWRNNGQAVSKTILWSEGLAEAWSGHWFTPPACLGCEDIFAECADVSLMDAWLPAYMEDYRGHSIALCRSTLADDVFRQGAEAGELSLRPIGIDDVRLSQQGVIRFKHEHLVPPHVPVRVSMSAKAWRERNDLDSFVRLMREARTPRPWTSRVLSRVAGLGRRGTRAL